MPEVTIEKDQQGRLQGVTDTDKALYLKWRDAVTNLKPGQAVSFSFELPRDPAFHCMHFKMLSCIFDNQEVFDSDAKFREWVERGAGHTETIGVGDAEFERVKSVSYAELDDAEFRKMHADVKRFLLSETALRRLWPHVPVGTAYAGMVTIMEGNRHG